MRTKKKIELRFETADDNLISDKRVTLKLLNALICLNKLFPDCSMMSKHKTVSSNTEIIKVTSDSKLVVSQSFSTQFTCLISQKLLDKTRFPTNFPRTFQQTSLIRQAAIN